jgi:hypothetical protein
MSRHLSSNGTNGSDDKNVSERDTRKGPAQYALQSFPKPLDCHRELLSVL